MLLHCRQQQGAHVELQHEFARADQAAELGRRHQPDLDARLARLGPAAAGPVSTKKECTRFDSRAVQGE